MIKCINIANYALIDQVEISLDKGLTVITGETGAGKSILLGAIGLTLGNRAEGNILADKSRKCIVEVEYDVTAYDVQGWFEEQELDYDTQVIIRREVYADGRSRAFINDTPVSNKLLKELGGFLIDIHSQHQSLLLGRPGYQLDVLDALSGNSELKKSYVVLYGERQQLLADLKELKRKAAEAAQEEDYLKFQFNQLDALHLREGEQTELEEEQELLTHAGKIRETYYSLVQTLSGAEQPVIQLLKNERSKVAAMSHIVKEATGYEQRLQSVILELEDMADEAERLAESVESSPQRMQVIEERLSAIYELLHKHRKERVEELIELRREIEGRLEGIASYEETIGEMEGKLAHAEKELNKQAEELHRTRMIGKGLLEKEMCGLLVELGIKFPQFVAEITTTEEFTPTGTDAVRFLFAANKNAQPGELSKIASGGEISRLMLSLKHILSRSQKLPVIIFDEIDTGVSGEIAHKIALMMKDMTTGMQVISITHLPQLAASGNAHLKVFKEEEPESSVTRIKSLSEEERVREIAAMISGSEVSDVAIQNARFLLNSLRLVDKENK